MQHSNEEKETSAVYDYQADAWNVYSCVPRHMSKLMKIASPYWEEKDGNRVTAAKWRLKGKQVRFAMETVLSEEERELRRQRARRMQSVK